MNWERRLREMVLAGGSLTAACSSAASTPGDAASDSAASGETSSSSSGASDALSAAETSSGSSSGGSSGGPNFCCNANGDPCCEYLHCDAAITPQCSAELACQADGGTYNFAGGCSFPGDASRDGGDSGIAKDASDAGCSGTAPNCFGNDVQMCCGQDPAGPASCVGGQWLCGTAPAPGCNGTSCLLRDASAG
jgi:hypothetical protein